MDKVYDKCCGIDVHKKLIVACFRKGNKQEVREFGATTRELLELSDWLKSGECEIVAMESTASYWKPLFNILESSDLNAIVVNAHHMKAVPGRKTDVKDAEWIADLLQHGLLQPSYIPDKSHRELRELVSYRKSLVGERSRELNRLQKMLEGANIKLSGTVRDINGKSARNILEFLITGESIDDTKYDEMYEKKIIAHNLKASKEQIIDDLNGVMTALQRRMMKELLVHLDELNVHIKNLNDEIDNYMKPEEKQAVAFIEEIPGIGHTSAQAIISVIGTDMSRFATDAHISSWAGLCPGDNESAKKRKSGKTRKGNSLLRSTLVICAHSCIRNKRSYFYAQYMRISAHRGRNRAYVAVAHSMLVAIYHVLKDGVVFNDLGADYYNQFNKERKINAYLKKLKALGWEGPIVAA
ncbi:IS110 family transposase [Oribacterium sp. NK2B42]|uniref:IS110 family transposase n=1 Tax=Oribacterium sp. NK2B42 TaxID=689781 RepID=UPI0003F562E0|nr:IS110 family transposase [Oribacterium sp. NK2B42]